MGLLTRFFVVAFAGFTMMIMVATALDPGEDFSGYMENLEQRRQDEELYRQRLSEHEVRVSGIPGCGVWLEEDSYCL